ncbi:MAG: caspase family protein, partial [Myxococcota bacterium]
MKACWMIGICFGFAALSNGPAWGAETARRFALVIGNNAGGPPAEDLRYAEDDARKVAAVLEELGGYRPSDVTVIKGAQADAVRQAFMRITRKVQAAHEQGFHATLLVYYSGHARGGELWMNGSRLPLSELRERLHQAPADVRIGIVDACEAGNLTRLKGGRRGPSFLFESDDSTPARGLILIGSSAVDEASQESDELGGSFFTHYLTSGLRGDADESGEGRVTLAEVYDYAYHRTVAMTAGTRSGPQHPTYRFDLEGQADVVLTDVSQGRSGLVFVAPVAGRYLVVDRARG